MRKKQKNANKKVKTLLNFEEYNEKFNGQNTRRKFQSISSEFFFLCSFGLSVELDFVVLCFEIVSSGTV